MNSSRAKIIPKHFHATPKQLNWTEIMQFISQTEQQHSASSIVTKKLSVIAKEQMKLTQIMLKHIPDLGILIFFSSL